MRHDRRINAVLDDRTGRQRLAAEGYATRWRDRLIAAVDRLRHPPTRFERWAQAWSGITGWLSLTQAHRLFHLARTVRAQGDVVEIGSAFGRSAVPLALGTRQFGSGRVYAIDPHTGGVGLHERYGELADEFSSLGPFLRNLVRFGVEDVVVPVVLPSHDAAKAWPGRPIRMLFVDGWHSYDAARRDVLDWGRWVTPGGLMIVHDYDWNDVRRAVDDALPQLSGFGRVLTPDENMAVVYRFDPAATRAAA